METAKGMNLSRGSVRLRTTGGQGVHGEVESEGFEEKYRAVIRGAAIDNATVRQRLHRDATRAREFLRGFEREHKLFDSAVRQIDNLTELINNLEQMGI